MKLRDLTILFFSLLCSIGSAQELLRGEVTFVTANNVYVHFENTNNIAIGDTLDLVKGAESLPCMVVTSKSSISCVCKIINGCKIDKADVVHFISVVVVPAIAAEQPPAQLQRDASITTEKNERNKERIRGRISGATYSTVNSNRGDDHRMMYRFSINADHIGNSKFSAESYINYRKLFPSNDRSFNYRTSYFNVYNLAVRYEPDSNTTITLGRKINNNASSLGAIDGLQAEKYFGKLYAGAIAGFRPDIATFGFNANLFQYGGYLGLQLNSDRIRSRTTAGLMQQTNKGATDRRYTYFQHTTTINNNFNIFSSAELDLFNQVNGNSGGARLTNLFVSSRYRFSKKVDLFASYDSRKRIVYYETYRTDVENMLEDDQARQGLRARLNIKPIKNVIVGISVGKRFQSDGQNSSNNYNGSLTFNKMPVIGGRWNFQFNRNLSSYLRSDIASVRYSKSLLNNRLTLNPYYRILMYRYASRGGADGVPLTTKQHYYGVDMAYNLSRTLVASLLGEMSTLKDEKNYRVNFSIIKRFDSKNKK